MTDSEIKQVYSAVGDFCIAIGTGDMERAQSAAAILNEIDWAADTDAAPHIHNMLFRDIYDPSATAEIRDAKLYLVDTVKEFEDRSEFMHNFIFARYALDTNNTEDMRTIIDKQLNSESEFSNPIVPIEVTYLGMLYRMCVDLKDYTAMATIKERWAV